MEEAGKRKALQGQSLQKQIVKGFSLTSKFSVPFSSRLTVIEQRYGSKIRQQRLFIFLVVFPVLTALVYFGFLASDRYISEAKFVIRAPNSSASPGLNVLMRGEPTSRTGDDTHAVNAFLMSREAASELARNHQLRDIMSRVEGDMFARFPNFYSRKDDEAFFEAYKRFIDVRIEPTTGISSLVVTAFRPDDAKEIAEACLRLAEAFVNKLQERAIRDEINFTRGLFEEARSYLGLVVERLAEYRNQEQVVDPKGESASRLAVATKLATEISQLEASLAQQMAMAPNSPMIPSLREKIRSMQGELDRERKLIVGDISSMATKFQGYELLMIERELAGRALVEAVIRMDKARQDGQRQMLYLQRVVEPSLSDYPAYPYRVIGFFLVLVAALIFWWLASSFARLILEHN